MHFRKFIYILGLSFLIVSNIAASNRSTYIYSLKQTVQNIYRNSTGNAYELSMPLMLAADTKNITLYKSLLKKMQVQLNKVKKPTYKAWLQGRILLAAQTVNDQKTQKVMIESMQKILMSQNTAHNIFHTWASGYIAIYFARKNKRDSYRLWIKTANIQLSERQTPNLQNRIWTLVISIEASGAIRDEATFVTLVRNLNHTTEKKSITSSLNLLPNDARGYRAWAISIVRRAAAQVKNQAIYSQLTAPLQNALQTSKDVNNSLLALAEKHF